MASIKSHSHKSGSRTRSGGRGFQMKGCCGNVTKLERHNVRKANRKANREALVMIADGRAEACNVPYRLDIWPWS